MIGYPTGPGVRPGATGETSQAAADFVAPHVAGMCADVLACLREGPATPEELTDKLQQFAPKRVLLTTVRARCCQLRALGMVVDDGTRGLGESGRVHVIRWRLSTPDEFRAVQAARAARDAERTAA